MDEKDKLAMKAAILKFAINTHLERYSELWNSAKEQMAKLHPEWSDAKRLMMAYEVMDSVIGHRVIEELEKTKLIVVTQDEAKRRELVEELTAMPPFIIGSLEPITEIIEAVHKEVSQQD